MQALSIISFKHPLIILQICLFVTSGFTSGSHLTATSNKQQQLPVKTARQQQISSLASTLIRPIECRNANNQSEMGICMFSIDCMHNKGVALSVCKHNYFVGTCCRLPDHNNFIGIVYDLRDTASGYLLEARRAASTSTTPTAINQAQSHSSHELDLQERSTTGSGSTRSPNQELVQSTQQMMPAMGNMKPDERYVISSNSLFQLGVDSYPPGKRVESADDIMTSNKSASLPAEGGARQSSANQYVTPEVPMRSSSVEHGDSELSSTSKQAMVDDQSSNHHHSDATTTTAALSSSTANHQRDMMLMMSSEYPAHQSDSSSEVLGTLSSAHSGNYNQKTYTAAQLSSTTTLSDRSSTATTTSGSSAATVSTFSPSESTPDLDPSSQQPSQLMSLINSGPGSQPNSDIMTTMSGVSGGQAASNASPSDQEFTLSTLSQLQSSTRQANQDPVALVGSHEANESSTTTSEQPEVSQTTTPFTTSLSTVQLPNLISTSSGHHRDEPSPSYVIDQTLSSTQSTSGSSSSTSAQLESGSSSASTSNNQIDSSPSSSSSSSSISSSSTALSMSLPTELASNNQSATSELESNKTTTQTLVSPSSVVSSPAPDQQFVTQSSGSQASSSKLSGSYHYPSSGSGLASPFGYSQLYSSQHSAPTSASTSTSFTSSNINQYHNQYHMITPAQKHSVAHSAGQINYAGINGNVAQQPMAAKTVSSSQGANNLIPNLSHLQSAILSHIPFKLASGLGSYLQAAMKPNGGRPLMSSNTAPALQFGNTGQTNQSGKLGSSSSSGQQQVKFPNTSPVTSTSTTEQPASQTTILAGSSNTNTTTTTTTTTTTSGSDNNSTRNSQIELSSSNNSSLDTTSLSNKSSNVQLLANWPIQTNPFLLGGSGSSFSSQLSQSARDALLVCGRPQGGSSSSSGYNSAGSPLGGSSAASQAAALSVNSNAEAKKRVARIVGGNQSVFGQWPWMVSLRQWRKGAFLHKCGAALLNENWAITAAHCVESVKPADLLLRLGEFDVSNQNEPYPFVERRVKSIVSHPLFDPKTFEYDLALLRFVEPIRFERNIIPVCIPNGNDSYVDRIATVIGWGRLYEDGPLPDIIQHVDVPIITNRECEVMYKNAGFLEEIPDIFICAGINKGGRDSCEGDSGGPLTMVDHDGRSYLVGIISWGIGCALPSQPGVYTRITTFSNWINDIVAF